MVMQENSDSKLKSKLTFRNNFWVNSFWYVLILYFNINYVQNGDIGNFQGFEVLVKRLKDDRSVCKEYAEFLRQRWVIVVDFQSQHFDIKYDRCLIEEQYGKALIKLAKTGSSKDEMG